MRRLSASAQAAAASSSSCSGRKVGSSVAIRSAIGGCVRELADSPARKNMCAACSPSASGCASPDGTRNLQQRAAQAPGIARELHARRVREALALARNGRLQEAREKHADVAEDHHGRPCGQQEARRRRARLSRPPRGV